MIVNEGGSLVFFSRYSSNIIISTKTVEALICNPSCRAAIGTVWIIFPTEFLYLFVEAIDFARTKNFRCPNNWGE